MERFTDRYLTSDKQLAFLWFGSFVAVCVGVKFGFIDADTALGLSALTGFVLGFRKYIYEKKKDRRDVLAELVRFYSEDILIANQRFITELEKRKLKYTRIRLNDLNIKSVVGSYPEEAKMQMKITKIQDLYTIQTVDILNKLEEFSMRIINNGSVRDDYLVPLRMTFVQIVEANGIALMRHRLVETGKDTYSKTLEIYYVWENLVDDKTIEERMTSEWSKLYAETD
jgi:hypothetical protein